MQFQHQILKRGKNAGRWVISFYCRNKVCLRHNTEQQKKQGIKLSKSIRAKFVLAGIEWQLRHLTKESERAYAMYKDRLEVQIATQRATIKNKLNDAKRLLSDNEREYARYQLSQRDNPDDYKKHHNGKLEKHRRLINFYNDAIESNKAELDKLDTALPSESEFYELTRSKVLDLLSTDDIMVIDAICREFVTNLRAGNDSTPVIKLNPPYNLLVDLAEISSGREQPTVLELYNFIIETSDHYSNLCEELEAIRSYQPKDEALVML